MSDDERDDQADEEPLLEVAGQILDGSPVEWPATAPAISPYQDELRAIAALSHLSPPPLGQWGHLKLLERVGSGAFGDVFRAWDTRLDREVALKLLHRTAPGRTSEEDVIAEARLLARIRHPNVVTVFGAEAIDGRVGFWTEFIHGETLSALIARTGPLAAGDAIATGRVLCHALAAIHAAGIVHGDVKAHNVIRDPEGRIVLVDFGTGLDRVRDGGASTPATYGTPLYLAPELWRQVSPTPQSDVYSLAVLLYFLATGAYPIRAKTAAEVREAQAAGRLVPLKRERPDLPAAFASAVDRALAVDPRARFQSADAFGAALERCDPAVVRRRRSRVAALVGALAATASIGAITWSLASRSTSAGKPPVVTQVTVQSPEERVAALALSADGRKLAFAAANQLKIQNIDSREVQPVALPPDFEEIKDLAWLPDSSTILIATSGGVWRTPIASPAFERISAIGGLIATSPDGRYVAISDSARPRLVVMTPKGTDVREIVAYSRPTSVSRPTWSPDSRLVAFLKHWTEPTLRRGAIVAVPHDGGGERVVLEPARGLFSLAWAPDGRILYSSQQAVLNRFTDLFSIPVSGETGEATGAATVILEGRDLRFERPTITRDGSRMAFLSVYVGSQVQVSEFDEAAPSLQPPRRVTFTSRFDQPVGWIAATAELVFQADGRNQFPFYRQPVDRAEPKLLLPRGVPEAENAAVTLDGRWLVYMTGAAMWRAAMTGGAATKLFDIGWDNSWLTCAGSKPAVCVFSRTRSGATKLVSFDPEIGRPREHPPLPVATWDMSPDGLRVVGVETNARSAGLVMLELANDRVSRVPTPAIAGASFAAWTHSGERWLVSRPMGTDGSQVFLVDRGGGAKLLWSSPGMRLGRPMVSPDGRQVAFARGLTEANAWMISLR